MGVEPIGDRSHCHPPVSKITQCVDPIRKFSILFHPAMTSQGSVLCRLDAF